LSPWSLRFSVTPISLMSSMFVGCSGSALLPMDDQGVARVCSVVAKAAKSTPVATANPVTRSGAAVYPLVRFDHHGAGVLRCPFA